MHVHGSSRQAKGRRAAAKGMTRSTDWVWALPLLLTAYCSTSQVLRAAPRCPTFV